MATPPLVRTPLVSTVAAINGDTICRWLGFGFQPTGSGTKFNRFLIPWTTFHPLSLLHPHLWISPWPILPGKGLDPVDDTIICVNILHGERDDEGLVEPGNIPNQSSLTCSSAPSRYPSTYGYDITETIGRSKNGLHKTICWGTQPH